MVDGTLGDGGHAAAFVAQGAQVLGIDRDPEAIAIARATTRRRRASPICRRRTRATRRSGRSPRFQPDFILLDLGVSSRQLDQADRGFTFRPGAPLDMRMGPDAPTAAEWLASVDEPELTAAAAATMPTSAGRREWPARCCAGAPTHRS